MAIVTLSQLREAGACAPELKRMKAKFGAKVDLTEDFVLANATLDWDWAAGRLLTLDGVTEYRRVRDAALAEYERVKATAWAEYERVMAPAWAEFKRVRYAALAEYGRVRYAALAEYDRVMAPALAEYDRVSALALAEYDRVSALALAEYRRVRALAFVRLYNQENIHEDQDRPRDIRQDGSPSRAPG